MPTVSITYNSMAYYNGGWSSYSSSRNGYVGRASDSGYLAVSIKFSTPAFSGVPSAVNFSVPMIYAWTSSSVPCYVSLTTVDPSTLGTVYAASSPGTDSGRIYSSTHTFSGLSSTVQKMSLSLSLSTIQPSTTYYLVLSPNGTSNIGAQVYGSSSTTGTVTYSYPASVPTLSSSSVALGNSVTITTNRQSSSYTHTITYVFGSTSGTIGTSVGASVSWTPPLALANQIPNATSGTCTITCKTYSGSTLYGTNTVQCTLTVPSSVVPTIDSYSIAVDNSANSTIAGWGLYVSGYSKAKLTASASGSYGSTISSFAISNAYSATVSGSSLSYTGSTLSSSGTKTFSIVAKDSRGRSSTSASSSVTVYAYSNPTISSFSVERGSTNSTKVTVKANWTYSSLNGNNSTAATLYYKLSTSSSWTTYGTLTKNASTTLSTTFDETHSYNFRVVVTDAVGNSAQDETFVSTMSVLLDFKAGGKGLGIGKIAETDSMEVALDAKFMGTVYIYDSSGTEMTLEEYIRTITGV